ncbi:MAG TPA: HNH endonuclease family protein [Solirubrobacterales bacterium]|nr:HNH endonuclease family protein [Solirubrobacterales bacterium]
MKRFSRWITIAILVAVALSIAGAAPASAQAATCGEFTTQLAAQEAANTSDPDGDGIYCESNPCPCSSEWYAQHETNTSPNNPPDSNGLPPVPGSTEAPPPGSLPRQVWPLRDRRGLHRGLRRVPRRLLAKARHFIRQVRTAVKGTSTGYSREEFGSAWTDTAVNIPWAGNGCDTRDDILRRDLTELRLRPDTGDCVVEAGRLRNPYLGTTILFSKSDASAVPIDHVFPLSLAWQMGARGWSDERRVQLANDPLNLLAADRSSNSSKGDSGPAEWLPPSRGIRCAYSVRFAQVARKYELPVTGIDKRTMLRQCARLP